MLLLAHADQPAGDAGNFDGRSDIDLHHLPHAVKPVLINSVGYTGDFPWVGFVSSLSTTWQ